MKKGIILLVAFIYLVILAGIGIYLYIFTSTYSGQSQFGRFTVLISFAASSAESYSVTKLTQFLKSGEIFSSKTEFFFKGEDTNWNGELDEGEDVNGNGVLDTYNLELESSSSPSFFAVVQKEDEFISSFRVKIVDESAKINVNDKSLGTYNTLENLSNILNLDINIGDIIRSFHNSNPESEDITIPALKKLLGNHYSYLRQFLTVYGRQRPVMEIENHSYQQGNVKSIKDLKMPALKLVKRAPVNINTITKPVLLSILNNIEGFYLDESTLKKDPIVVVGTSTLQTSFSIGQLKKIDSGNINDEFVSQFFEYISTKPFFNLLDFGNFLFNNGKKFLKEEVLQLIFVNANPNTNNIIRTNADWRLLNLDKKQVWFSTDKTFVTRPTIEFSYYPSGFFEIEIISYVTNKNKILAREKRVVIYDFLEEHIDTNQEDFLKGEIENISYSVTTHGKKLLTLPYIEKDVYKKSVKDGQIILSPLFILEKKKDDTLFYINFTPDMKDKIAIGKEGEFLPDGLLTDTYIKIEYPFDNILKRDIIDVSNIIEEEMKKIDEKYRPYAQMMVGDYLPLIQRTSSIKFAILLWRKSAYNPFSMPLQVLFNMTNPRKRPSKETSYEHTPYFFLFYVNPQNNQMPQLPFCTSPYFLYWGLPYPSSYTFYCSQYPSTTLYRWELLSFYINTQPVQRIKEFMTQEFKDIMDRIRKMISILSNQLPQNVQTMGGELKKMEEGLQEIHRKFNKAINQKLIDISKIFVNGEETTVPLGVIGLRKENDIVALKNLEGFVNRIPEGFFERKENTFSIGGSFDDMFWNFPSYHTISEFLILKPDENFEDYIKNIWKRGRYFNQEAKFKSNEINKGGLRLLKAFTTIYNYNDKEIEIALKVGSGFYPIPYSGIINFASTPSDFTRYEVIFRPKGSIYNTPVLDEITLLFLKSPSSLYRE